MKFGPEIIGARILSIERKLFFKQLASQFPFRRKKNTNLPGPIKFYLRACQGYISLCQYISAPPIFHHVTANAHTVSLCAISTQQHMYGFRASLQYTESQCHTLCPYQHFECNCQLNVYGFRGCMLSYIYRQRSGAKGHGFLTLFGLWVWILMVWILDGVEGLVLVMLYSLL